MRCTLAVFGGFRFLKNERVDLFWVAIEIVLVFK